MPGPGDATSGGRKSASRKQIIAVCLIVASLVAVFVTIIAFVLRQGDVQPSEEEKEAFWDSWKGSSKKKTDERNQFQSGGTILSWDYFNARPPVRCLRRTSRPANTT